MGWTTGFRFPAGALLGFFISPLRPDRLWGPLSHLSNGYGAVLPLGIKRPGRESDHSPPSSAKAPNVWSYTSTPPILLYGLEIN